jgi:hypothetical protein
VRRRKKRAERAVWLLPVCVNVCVSVFEKQQQNEGEKKRQRECVSRESCQCLIKMAAKEKLLDESEGE